MKNLRHILYGALALALGSTFTACQDDIAAPSTDIIAPVATWQANTTIMELKTEFWDAWKNDRQGRDEQSELNNTFVVGTKENGEHYIIKGRVITSDEEGNVFRKIAIQDETAALPISIYSYNLYLTYAPGQEILVDVTGLAVGMYGGLFQLGEPFWYESNSIWETSYLSPEKFAEHCQLNGLPDRSKIEVKHINNFSDVYGDLKYWQGRLIRIDNITYQPQVFAGAGGIVTTFGVYQVSNFYQKVVDSNNGTMQIGVSGYADFFWREMPTEPSDLQAFLSYYGSSSHGTDNWQLTPVNYAGVMNVGNPTLPRGTKDTPWRPGEVIEFEANNSSQFGWVEGYIVGTVAPEVTTVTSNDDIEWGADATLNNTVVIAPQQDTRDFNECIVMALPQGSVMRKYVALAAHPENLGKKLKVYGATDKYLGTWGMTISQGTADEFELEGVVIPGSAPDAGDGTEEKPYNCSQIIAMNPTDKENAVEAGVWVTGYIVGYFYNFEAHFNTSGAQASNILLSDKQTPDLATECICVQLVAKTDVRNALNLLDNPNMLGAQVAVQGDVMLYNTLPGIKNTYLYNVISVPEAAETGTTIYEGLLAASTTCDWTLNVDIEGGSNIWTWKSYNNSYYLNGSAYSSNGAKDATSWAVSPEIDLTGYSEANVTFEHAAKFQTTLKDVCGLYVDAGDGWQQLAIPNWPAAGGWVFVSSDVIDLSAYAGKKIKLAFKYGSTPLGADTWEIKNLKVTANK